MSYKSLLIIIVSFIEWSSNHYPCWYASCWRHLSLSATQNKYRFSSTPHLSSRSVIVDIKYFNPIALVLLHQRELKYAMQQSLFVVALLHLQSLAVLGRDVSLLTQKCCLLFLPCPRDRSKNLTRFFFQPRHVTVLKWRWDRQEWRQKHNLSISVFTGLSGTHLRCYKLYQYKRKRI